jgi:hypothetical protein
VLAAAARRFLLILGVVGGASVLIGLAIGLLAGSSPNRSISLGLYLSGAVLLIGGFLLGNRGPLRRAGESGGDGGGGAMTFGRSLRRATPDEFRDSVNMTVLLVVIGFILLIAAVAVDSRYELV